MYFCAKHFNMKTSSHEDLLDKIKGLPDESLEQLSDFIDFLLYKEEINAVRQGLEDIKNGNVYSHESVMEEMTNYINSKKKS